MGVKWESLSVKWESLRINIINVQSKKSLIFIKNFYKIKSNTLPNLKNRKYKYVFNLKKNKIVTGK